MLSVHGRNGRYFEGKILEVCTSSTGSISGIHYRHREYSEYFEPLSCGYCHTSSISGTGIRTAIPAVYTRSTKCVRYSRVYGQHLCKAHHHGAATRAHLPSLRRVVRLRPGAFRLPEQLHDVNVQRREVLQDLANNERQRAVRVFSVWPITGLLKFSAYGQSGGFHDMNQDMNVQLREVFQDPAYHKTMAGESFQCLVDQRISVL